MYYNVKKWVYYAYKPPQRMEKRKEMSAMKKRTLMMALAIAAALLIATTGTLAYLTDTDSDVNVMTLGNVDIEQIELERAEGVEHSGLLEEGDLLPFKEGKPLYPAYPKEDGAYTAEQNELLRWGPYVTAESTGDENGAGNGLWNDDKLVGAVDKFVFVENTGSSPAYYRTVFAFECPEGIEYSQGSDKQLMMNINGSKTYFNWEEHGYVMIDDQRYLLMSATYQKELAAGEISRPSLLQVAMMDSCTNEEVALLGDTYEILVVSQAVQTTNFPDAETALNAAFGEISAENYPWLKEDGSNNVIHVADQAAFDEAVKNAEAGDTIILANGEFVLNGKMKAGVSYIGSGNTVISNPTGNALGGSLTDVTISNMVLDGSNGLRYCYANGDVVLDSCTIEGDVYGVHFDGGSGRVTLRNCDITGWNSFGKSLESVSFENCTFHKLNYGCVRFYQNGFMSDCEFDSDFSWIDAAAEGVTIQIDRCAVVDDANAVTDLLFNNGVTTPTWIVDGVEVEVPSH